MTRIVNEGGRAQMTNKAGRRRSPGATQHRGRYEEERATITDHSTVRG